MFHNYRTFFQAEVWSRVQVSCRWQTAVKTETSPPQLNSKPSASSWRGPLCVFNNFEHYRQSKAAKLQKNTPLCPFWCCTEASCVAQPHSTLPLIAGQLQWQQWQSSLQYNLLVRGRGGTNIDLFWVVPKDRTQGMASGCGRADLGWVLGEVFSPRCWLGTGIGWKGRNCGAWLQVLFAITSGWTSCSRKVPTKL